MSDDQKTVFISYRRSVSAFIARSIFFDLRTHGYDVFMDVESSDSGTFDTIIMNQIGARAHFLIILTPGTLERCNEPNDWLRAEIERAMELNRNIVPIMVNNFSFSNDEKYLTNKLAKLPRFNGITLTHELFTEGMERLRTRFLKLPTVDVTIEPAPPSDLPKVEEKIAEAIAVPVPTEAELTAEQYFHRAFYRPDNDYQGQIADYSEAIRLNPELAAAYNNRGEVHRLNGDFQKAIEDYDYAIHLESREAIVFSNRGIAHFEMGDVERAMKDFDYAIELNPHLAEVYNNRGEALRRSHDLQGAIRDFDFAIQLNPQYAAAYCNRGIARLAMGNLREALIDFDTAIQLNPQYATAYCNRGVVYARNGDYSRAIEDFSYAIRIYPQYSDAHYNQAIARQNIGDLKGAIESYKKYLGSRAGTMQSDHEEVEKRVQALEILLGKKKRN